MQRPQYIFYNAFTIMLSSRLLQPVIDGKKIIIVIFLKRERERERERERKVNLKHRICCKKIL